MSQFTFLKTTFNVLLIVTLAFVASTLVLASFDTPLKLRLFSVESGSMEPTLPIGSLVIVRPQENYQAGDVITVRSARSQKETFTHRLFAVVQDGDSGRMVYRTKGDANEDADPGFTQPRLVLGKVVKWLPWIGHVISFSKTQVGLVVLIVIPATIIIYSELVSIKNEVVRMVTAAKKEKTDKTINN